MCKNYKKYLNYFWYILGFAFYLAIDQLSKIWAIKNLIFGAPKRIAPFLSFNLQGNFGCAMSIFEEAGKISQAGLIWLGLFIILAVTVHGLFRLSKNKSALAELLIISGGASNLLDRAFRGCVVDFISLNFYNYYWPTTFNLADCFIVLGTIMFTVRIME